VRAGKGEYQAAAYADQGRKVLEAHLLDGDIELYGEEIEIKLLEKIRDDRTFGDDVALRSAITGDVKNIRTYFKRLL
jgi:riboflavin kinase/FMN adenylyltransferase